MTGCKTPTLKRLVEELQCRINHMAEAAYAAGPALLGPRAARLLSSMFSEFFVPCFIAGPK
jgi:uncharacterized membrane protein